MRMLIFSSSSNDVLHSCQQLRAGIRRTARSRAARLLFLFFSRYTMTYIGQTQPYALSWVPPSGCWDGSQVPDKVGDMKHFMIWKSATHCQMWIPPSVKISVVKGPTSAKLCVRDGFRSSETWCASKNNEQTKGFNAVWNTWSQKNGNLTSVNGNNCRQVTADLHEHSL